MPVQTTVTNYVTFPDGAKVNIKASGDVAWTDLGVIGSSVTNTLEWDENEVESANAGTLVKQIRNMRITGGFTLWNLDPAGIEKLGNGIFTKVVTDTTPITTGDNQVIASGDWAYGVTMPLVFTKLGTNYKATAVTLTSVTGSVDGALAENVDYFIHPDENSPSGYSISFIDSADITTLVQNITIVFASFTPVASTKLYAGQSTATLTSYALQIIHTDDNGKTRGIELFAVESNSGGFAFNFKGANEDGVEELPMTYTAKLDTTKTSGRQLIEIFRDENAE